VQASTVQHRRKDDWAARTASAPEPPPSETLYRAALGWMDGEPAAAGDNANGNGSAPHAPGRVEWLQLWRRLQLPDRLVAYGEQLARARSERDVYTALTTHAVRIVGGYTCLVFVPRGPTSALRPACDPGLLRFDPELLSIAEPPASPGVIGPVAAQTGGPFAALRPLFTEEHAASLALAPFGTRGTVVLVERREGRAFTADDWELLRVLSVQAVAALEQAAVWSRMASLSASDPVTGLAGPEQLHAVITHAAAAAGWGEPVAVAMLALDGLGGATHQHGPLEADRLTRGVAEVVRDAIGERGIALRHSADEILLVLPGTSAAEAAALLSGVRERLARRVAVHAGIVEHGAGPCSPLDLAGRAAAAVPPRGRSPATGAPR
jgi:GGDEF domain-containing protein